jgi:hypothetical protein
MGNHFHLYSTATERVLDGWCQGWVSPRPDGGMDRCIVEAILSVDSKSGLKGDWLEMAVINEISAELKWSPRFFFARRKYGAGPELQRAVEDWNDAAWRRKSSVVRLLCRLAAKHAPAPADSLEAAWALPSTAEPRESEPIA